MIASRHTQSLTEFRQTASETLERLNKSGEAEILTVNGEARAVLLSPELYDELARQAELTRDVAVMRKGMAEIKAGQGQEANAFFDELRAELNQMKSHKAPSKGRRR